MGVLRILLKLLIAVPGGLQARRSPEKTHALYGFNAQKPPFDGMEADELAETLVKWGGYHCVRSLLQRGGGSISERLRGGEAGGLCGRHGKIIA